VPRSAESQDGQEHRVLIVDNRSDDDLDPSSRSKAAEVAQDGSATPIAHASQDAESITPLPLHAGYSPTAGLPVASDLLNTADWQSEHADTFCDVSLGLPVILSASNALPSNFTSPLSPYLPSREAQQESREHLNAVQPLENILEACLFRYYIEEMAHWVSNLRCLQDHR
jgi:hypothetical protein